MISTQVAAAFHDLDLVQTLPPWSARGASARRATNAAPLATLDTTSPHVPTQVLLGRLLDVVMGRPEHPAPRGRRGRRRDLVGNGGGWRLGVPGQAGGAAGPLVVRHSAGPVGLVGWCAGGAGGSGGLAAGMAATPDCSGSAEPVAWRGPAAWRGRRYRWCWWPGRDLYGAGGHGVRRRPGPIGGGADTAVASGLAVGRAGNGGAGDTAPGVAGAAGEDLSPHAGHPVGRRRRRRWRHRGRGGHWPAPVGRRRPVGWRDRRGWRGRIFSCP
ncbi:hypothetical protein [Mycobacterium tuberculosis]|uniref:hypothetical protein n=1 Tax=Mycobacterium tuberculosis TaxID=1773 RepID=UPI003D7C28F2